MKCPMCNKGKLRTERKDYPFLESGLDNVVLVGLEVRTCNNPECGEELPVIPKLSELHRVIAHTLARQPQKLRGSEIRFLRKYLGLSGNDAAKTLGVAPETLSRWENEQSSMGVSVEKLLRYAALMQQPTEVYPPVEVLSKMAREKAPRGQIRLNAKKAIWLPAAA